MWMMLHTHQVKWTHVLTWSCFKALPVLYPPLRNVIGGLTFSQLISVLKDLTSVTSYESLTLACQNKVCSFFAAFFSPSYFCVELLFFFSFKFQFGLSLLYALLSHGEKLLSSGVPLEPSIGDFETWCGVVRHLCLCQRMTISMYVGFWHPHLCCL